MSARKKVRRADQPGLLIPQAQKQQIDMPKKPSKEQLSQWHTLVASRFVESVQYDVDSKVGAIGHYRERTRGTGLKCRPAGAVDCMQHEIESAVRAIGVL